MQDIWLTLTELGIERYTIILILALPVVSTIVGIARHMIGLKTLSIYAPIVLTYAFIELGFDRRTDLINYVDGLKYGLALFIIVFITSTGFYKLTRGLKLHFYPKMSLIFTAVAIMTMISIIAAAYLGRNGYININIFSVVLITAVSERLISIYAKTNFKNTLYISIETLILTVINYSLISWTAFQEFMLYNPWVLAVLILINLYVGTFTGLRLREYWRFREILDIDYTNENGDRPDNK
jgi:hypothetical protein